MVNVCKASRRISDGELGPQIRGIIEQMGIEAAFLIRTAIDSYVDADTSLAAALDDIDDRLDEIHAEYVGAIFEAQNNGELQVQPAVQLALVGRYYERIGDHAVEIGDRVQYMVTRWMREHTRAAREAFRRGSDPLGLHHVSQMRHTLLGLIPLAKRLSDTALREPNAQA